MLAAVASVPEWEMDAARAGAIEKATMTLAELYPVGFNRKLIAWTNFSFAFGGWFIPGAVAWWKRPGKHPNDALRSRRQPEPKQAPEQPAQQTSGGFDLPMVSRAADAPIQVPSQAWQQPGDILDPNPSEDIAGE